MQNGTNNLFQLVSSDLYKKVQKYKSFVVFFSTCKIKEKIKDYFFFFSFIYVIILVAELKNQFLSLS